MNVSTAPRQSKVELRAELARLTKEFQENGGAITVLAPRSRKLEKKARAAGTTKAVARRKILPPRPPQLRMERCLPVPANANSPLPQLFVGEAA